jgi:hypothetical protein
MITFSNQRTLAGTALALAILTLFTFAIAINTPPITGVFCLEGCIDYPYTDGADRYPRDYWWMFPAMIMLFAYLLLVYGIQQVMVDKRSYTTLALILSSMSTLLLVANYFLQVTVVAPSLLAGEYEGMAAWTQYNPRGFFIALEELGYLLMSLSFLILAPTFSGKTSLEKSIRWILLAGCGLTLLVLIWIAWGYGLERDYRFEVAVISIDWLVLIIAGFLMFRLYRRKDFILK